MTSLWEGKTAVITGAGSGIGFGCAQLFSESGVRVVLLGRQRAKLEAAAKKLSGETLPLACNVVDEASVGTTFEMIGKAWGGIDFLVNNAGIVNPGLLEVQSVTGWNEVMNTNVRGPWLCARAALPWMKNRGGGAIVNIGSLAGIRGTNKFPGFGVYTASKFAVVGLTEAMATEFMEFGIRVNCVAPGAVDTPLLRAVAPQLKTQAEPRDIAESVLFLCDPERSRLTSGSTLEIFTNA
ncbi:MAG: SDR family oxidoreductase [Deltaproteobacteria bacterium]|nr:SDR family oxidoreductase [Deltaproteobacteria bacterium]MBI3295372.1 SDR family oxidoreductase [Deltaproteobacteria bacterium]